MLGNGPQVLGNTIGPPVLGKGPHLLGNGPQVLGNTNGPPVLGKGPHLLGIMSHLALLYVAFGIMSHSGLCRSALCRLALCCIRGYVVWHNVAFGIMLLSPYVDRLCVIRRIVARPNVVRCNFVRPTAGVSIQLVP